MRTNSSYNNCFNLLCVLCVKPLRSLREKYASLFIYFLVSSGSLIAQKDSTLQLNLVKQIDGNFKDVAVDNLGNIYAVSNTNQIKKLNPNYDSIAVYNETRRFGSIDFIDVNNPLKILVYYKNFATIVVLDRFLNIVNTIDLRKQNLQNISTICSSYDNKIWLYDEISNTIKKIDDAGKVVFESIDFRLLLSNGFNANQIIDSDGNLYIYGTNYGLLMFDYYGAFQKKISLPYLKNIVISDNKLVGFRNDSLQVYYLKTYTSTQVKLTKKMATTTKLLLLQPQKLVVIDSSNMLNIYSNN